jgi:hypothetical protein
MAKGPTESYGGIYYAVRTPRAWKLLTYSFASPEDDANHMEWWEHAVAASVVKAWIKRAGPKRKQLLEDIKLLSYAFPRGRLSKVGDDYLFLHGADLTKQMGVTKVQIEAAFGVVKRCRWEFDEHEQCQQDDQFELLRHLCIKETWNAV